MAKIDGEYLICVDCALTAANGECGERPADAPEPLNKISGYVVVGDEYGFSNRTCEGCGDPLAGDRFEAVTLTD